MSERLRVLTWHVHGSYLWYLAHAPHDFYVPVHGPRSRAGEPQPGYAGRAGTLPWPDNLTEVDAADVAESDFDVVVFQSRTNWDIDQHEICSADQRNGPRIYLEHDPPRRSPFEEPHPVSDPDVLVVHVTHFNRLMWDNSGPTTVVEHGVTVPREVVWTGEKPRGLVIVNHLARRGRRLGLDLFESMRERIPLDLVGMGSEEVGGLGEVPPPGIPAFAARYRFVFNPIRWTSLGLAVCEAMAAGLPIVGLATTEMATVVDNGVSGYVDTDPDRLAGVMENLLADHGAAARLSAGARRTAATRFGIDRFAADWDATLRRVAGQSRMAAARR